MAYTNPFKKKPTFKDKAKRFFRKSALILAFGSAVGIPGYNYYGTREEFEVTIKSVNGTTIETDKGNFANRPTRMYFKDDKDTEDFAQILKPGQTVKISVYGMQPRIGSFSFDDFRSYRNIYNVKALSTTNPAPAEMPPALTTELPLPQQPAEEISPAPVDIPLPSETSEPASSHVLKESAVKEDPLKPEVCVSNGNLEDITQKTPEISRALVLMEKLPLTGKDIFDMLKNPDNNIRTCLIPQSEESTLSGTFSNKEAKIERGEGTNTTFHEYFHGWQDVNSSEENMFSLTMQDAVISNLLKEAAAVAYEIAAEKEAENRGLSFYKPPATVTQVPGGIITSSRESASTNPETKAAFLTAYNEAWEKNATLDAKTREAKALEAGGQAVVRRLLEGKDANWQNAYTQLTLTNIRNNQQMFRKDGRENKAGYDSKRSNVYRLQGALGSKINFIPEEYLGENAKQNIEKCFQVMGFRSGAAENAPRVVERKTVLFPR